MKLMKFAEFGSTGAALTSVFHQLVRGKSGSGPGSGPQRRLIGEWHTERAAAGPALVER